MREFPGFAFTSACAAYYEWVEAVDPDMFEEIRQRVRDFVDRYGAKGRVMARIRTDMTDRSQDAIARDELYHYSLEYYNKLYQR